MKLGAFLLLLMLLIGLDFAAQTSITTVQTSIPTTMTVTTIPNQNSNTVYINASILNAEHTLLSTYNTNPSNGSNFNTTKGLNLNQLNSVYSSLSSDLQNVTLNKPILNNVTENLTYGSIRQFGALQTPNNFLGYIVNENGTDVNQSLQNPIIDVYKINVIKATPKMCIDVSGELDCEPNATVYLHPIYYASATSYNIIITSNSSLLQRNYANFTMSIFWSNGTTLNQKVEGSNVTFYEKINNIPTYITGEIEFSSDGNSNYTNEDPTAFILPSKILDYIPITLTNNQNVPTAPNLPINFTFNAGAYDLYTTCSLNNTELSFANGTIANSWIEGNQLNYLSANVLCISRSSVNSPMSPANAVNIWFKSPNYNWIGASGGTNTIYLDFAGNVITTSNNLFTSTVGEAPTFNCVGNTGYSNLFKCKGSYALYDSAPSVFTYETNFSGSSIPSSLAIISSNNVAGNIIIANSLSISTPTDVGSQNALVTKTTYTEPLILDVLVDNETQIIGNPSFYFGEGITNLFSTKGVGGSCSSYSYNRQSVLATYLDIETGCIETQLGSTQVYLQMLCN